MSEYGEWLDLVKNDVTAGAEVFMKKNRYDDIVTIAMKKYLEDAEKGSTYNGPKKDNFMDNVPTAFEARIA